MLLYKRNSLYLLNLKHVIKSQGGENDFPVSINSLLHVQSTLYDLRIKNIFSVCGSNQNDSICFLKPVKKFQNL